MEKIKTNKTLVAAHHISTSLNEIGKYVGISPQKVEKELIRQHIEIDGPQVWKYVGCDGNPDTVFDLYICLPVKRKGVDNDFISFVNLEAVNCVSIRHKGSWDLLGDSYQIGFENIFKNQLKPTGSCREVYHVCDFEIPDNCITEIQIEIV